MAEFTKICDEPIFYCFIYEAINLKNWVFDWKIGFPGENWKCGYIVPLKNALSMRRKRQKNNLSVGNWIKRLELFLIFVLHIWSNKVQKKKFFAFWRKKFSKKSFFGLPNDLVCLKKLQNSGYNGQKNFRPIASKSGGG